MFDDFFVRAMVAGIGVALTAGPLGCFVVWRRMAYFGDTMAHSALLGVALSLLLQLNLIVSVFLVASAVSILLLFLQRRQALSADALLGILSHSALAIGLVIVAFMSWVRIDLVSFLFGDILAVTRSDIAPIRFADAARNNYRLAADNAAIDFCNAGAQPTEDPDIDGIARGLESPGAPNDFGAFDLGAYEYETLFNGGMEGPR